MMRRRNIIVLCYHAVSSTWDSPMAVTPEVLATHARSLLRRGYRPTTFADPANTFHEKAMLCRAAENTCWFASVNYATEGSPTTSAVVKPDGSLLAWQPYGQEGLLVADIDTAEASRLLATRLRPN